MTDRDIVLYPLTNYVFASKDPQPEEDPSVNARIQRLQRSYEQQGQRRTVEGVLLVHDHGHPHVLILQIANAFFKLPGDYLQLGEDAIPGLKLRLEDRLGTSPLIEDRADWDVGAVLAQWWRPNFETFMYPFVPAHVTKPKECKTIYLVQLPETRALYVPKNMKILAVPLCELYDNQTRYGPQLAAIPHLLSRYNFVYAPPMTNA